MMILKRDVLGKRKQCILQTFTYQKGLTELTLRIMKNKQKLKILRYIREHAFSPFYLLITKD
jgi:hypothetical protein